ncbi:MAG: hypothetical protein EXR69_01400 [Myxococcales bacterium]|nr:hypothetical protein [Myxococcales bacterium]
MLLLSLLACKAAVIKLDGPADDVPGDSQDSAHDTGEAPDTADTSPTGSAPVALIADPGPVTAGLPLSLDASASYDPDGAPISGYEWACSDGQVGSDVIATFTFAAGPQTCTLLVTDDESLTGTTSVAFTVGPEATPRAAWTVMVFMNGDNDLEEWALGDMNELEEVGSTDEVNFIVQMDRSPDYTRIDGNWSGSRRFRAEADSDTRVIGSPVVEDLGETDSGDPQTVIDFANWTIENYPADHYALVLWDHGWGWSFTSDTEPKKGISWDESTNSDISAAKGEVLEIVDAVAAGIGGKLDLLGMDACVMGNWEIAQQVRDDVSVYLSSQDYEGTDGYDYTGMVDLVEDPSMDAAALASSVALHFHEIPDSTMSAVDLTRMDALTAALDGVAGALLLSADPGAMLELAAADAQGFDGEASIDHDLADMMDHLAAMDATADGADPATADIVAAALVARSALDDAVIVNYNVGGRVKNANGLSLYSPLRARLDNLWFDATWAAETSWGDFLEAARAW